MWQTSHVLVRCKQMHNIRKNPNKTQMAMKTLLPAAFFLFLQLRVKSPCLSSGSHLILLSDLHSLLPKMVNAYSFHLKNSDNSALQLFMFQSWEEQAEGAGPRIAQFMEGRMRENYSLSQIQWDSRPRSSTVLGQIIS